MTAIWDGNDSLNHYAFELLSKPEVDESASKEALQGEGSDSVQSMDTGQRVEAGGKGPAGIASVS